MAFTLKLAALFLALTGASAATARRPFQAGWILEDNYNVEREWAQFKRAFTKQYTAEEEVTRRGIFEESLKRAAARNVVNIEAGGKAVFGVTKFSDRTKEEFDLFKGRKGMGNPNNLERVAEPTEEAFSTNAVDWNALGYTTPVKNQGQCGSCWAFSATEQIESQFMLAGNAPWEFSVQQIASCTKGAFGCGGGDTTTAYDQLIGLTTKKGEVVGGLGSEAMAPYEQSMTEACNGLRCTVKCTDSGIGNLTTMIPDEALTGPYATVTGYSYATDPCTSGCNKQNLTKLNANLASTAPASICVNAESWGDYVGGVLTDAACGGHAYKDLDHCVQLTGFDLTADEPYYMVRNSWATNWGNDGYIYLSANDNTCGLANEATFVDLA